MSEQSNRPVIIKRKKVVSAEGHHGGAWKVAYADFVTAMMAFFLLMWLLNATTEEQRKGLADYFKPTIPVHRT
ncbi:MAG: flagellar motor protein MotB, partial [Pseudomonadota bacterium]